MDGSINGTSTWPWPSVTTGWTHGHACLSCGSWCWGSHGCCSHGYVTTTTTTTESGHEHDFIQARPPYEHTLFCRTCGETKKLRPPKA